MFSTILSQEAYLVTGAVPLLLVLVSVTRFLGSASWDTQDLLPSVISSHGFSRMKAHLQPRYRRHPNYLWETKKPSVKNENRLCSILWDIEYNSSCLSMGCVYPLPTTQHDKQLSRSWRIFQSHLWNDHEIIRTSRKICNSILSMNFAVSSMSTLWIARIRDNSMTQSDPEVLRLRGTCCR